MLAKRFPDQPPDQEMGLSRPKKIEQVRRSPRARPSGADAKRSMKTNDHGEGLKRPALSCSYEIQSQLTR